MKLHCHHCSHTIGTSDVTVEIVAIVKASASVRVSRGDAREVRKRCGACGWVNIFYPKANTRNRDIELKVG